MLGIKNGVKERGGEDKSGNGLENKMEKSKRGGKSELRDGTMMLCLLDPRRIPAIACWLAGTRLWARCHFTEPKKSRFPGPNPLPLALV